VVAGLLTASGAPRVSAVDHGRSARRDGESLAAGFRRCGGVDGDTRNIPMKRPDESCGLTAGPGETRITGQAGSTPARTIHEGNPRGVIGDLSRVGDPCGNARVTARVGFVPHLLAGGVVSLVGVKGDDMKIIERLRELLGKCKFGTTKATCEEGDMEVGCPDRFEVVAENGESIAMMMCREYSECDDGSALLSKSLNALPALLAVVEAAEKLVALRRTDQSPEWLEKELEAETELDGALGALEWGSHE